MIGRPLRTRSKFTSYTAPNTEYVNGSTLTYSPKTVWSAYRWIADQINPKFKGVRDIGECRNLLVQSLVDNRNFSQYYSSGSASQFTNTPEVFWPTGRNPEHGGSVGAPGYSSVVGDFSATPTFQELCLSAFKKQITQVPEKLSIVNFALELRDFRGIASAIRQIPGKLKTGQLQREVIKPLRVTRKLPKRVAKSAVDTFIAYNFAWVPFVSDISEFVKLTDTVAKRLSFLRKTRGKQVTVRFNQPNCYKHPGVGTIIYQHGSALFGRYDYELKDYVCEFNSSWRVTQNLNDLHNSWSEFRATLATLGVNNPTKIAWNAIPFSFLIDWVTPVGKWLERAAVQPFTGEWTVDRVCTSTREQYTIDCYYHNDQRNPSARILRRTVRVTRYFRTNGLPVAIPMIDFGNLTDTQQKLLLSLPLSRVLK